MNGSRDGRSSWSSDKSNGRPRFSKITRWMPATSCQTWNLTYHPVMLSKLLFGCDQGRELTIIENRERPEIVEYLQRYSSFSVQNGTTDISLPFAKLSSFPETLISRKQLREIELANGKAPPCIRLARGKFQLTNQDSVGGKNSRAFTI